VKLQVNATLPDMRTWLYIPENLIVHCHSWLLRMTQPNLPIMFFNPDFGGKYGLINVRLSTVLGDIRCCYVKVVFDGVKMAATGSSISTQTVTYLLKL